MKRWLPAAIGAAALLAGLVWSALFTAFDRDARLAPVPSAAADGIVVLTGGAERIEAALLLLEQRRAPALLISGVARGSDLAGLLRSNGPDAAQLAGSITLGREATSTQGNAAETAAWAAAHGARRLIVVTAGYHMRRALLELGRRSPGVEFVPMPVQPSAVRGRGGRAVLHLLANEFDKLLAAQLGLPSLLRGEER